MRGRYGVNAMPALDCRMERRAADLKVCSYVYPCLTGACLAIRRTKFRDKLSSPSDLQGATLKSCANRDMGYTLTKHMGYRCTLRCPSVRADEPLLAWVQVTEQDGAEVDVKAC